jgi:hypothetical protein
VCVCGCVFWGNDVCTHMKLYGCGVVIFRKCVCERERVWVCAGVSRNVTVCVCVWMRT